MYRLVDDVDTYADFLPWCNHSAVLKRSGDTVEATLELHKGAISKDEFKVFFSHFTLYCCEGVKHTLAKGQVIGGAGHDGRYFKYAIISSPAITTAGG